ncbi:MAG: ABC transporter permease, partial [Fulvivirga sp.]|nr:ABC transporter permease [Fulvivirga sp.]
MLKNYFKIAFRNLMRFKAYSAINLLGLAIGLTVGVLILLYITDELGYDKLHAKGDRIYKVVTKNTAGGSMETNAWPVAYLLKEKYPEVEEMLYSQKASSNMMVYYEGKRYEHDIFYAGEGFFEMFSFPLTEGDPSTALDKPGNVVISESVKKRYFGNDVVLGKTITLQDSLEFEITGVVKDIPRQSHIQFDMLISFATIEKKGFSYSEGWGNFNVRNYILLKEGSSINTLAKKASGLYMDPNYAGDMYREYGVEFEVDFIALKDIYLKSDVPNGFGPKGSMDKIYLVSGIALFVILLACINFINLTTARSIYRAREVGLRKLVGSSRTALFWQFLSESLIITLL